MNSGLAGAVAGSGGLEEAEVAPNRGFDGVVVVDCELTGALLGCPKLNRGFAGALAGGAASNVDCEKLEG